LVERDLDVCSGAVFDRHVLEFARFKDFAAFQAFYEFGVFFACHDLHAGVLALCHIAALLGRLGRRGWSHKSGCWISLFEPRKGILPEIGGILDPLLGLSSPSGDLFSLILTYFRRFATGHRRFAAIIHILTVLFNHCL
jgi:hypothetical protein